MSVIVGFFFVIIAFLKKNANKLMRLLLWLQIISFAMSFAVGNNIDNHSIKTLLILIFVNTCLLLIIYPWGYGRIKNISVKDKSFFEFYRKILYFVLKINLVVFILIAIAVWVFIPDIVALKRDKAFNDLYLQIPYFSFLYRYASITKYIGLLALPFFTYYLKRDNIKEARNALILSSSVFVIGVATYNRAVMITYLTLCVSVYYFIESELTIVKRKMINKYIKRILLVIIAFFVIITIGRFTSSSMDYYSDQIPKNSLVKEPSTYSLFNYASQGYINGVNFLEKYNGENKIYGKGITYDFMQALAFFNLVSWESEDYFKATDKAYNIPGLSDNNKSDNFHGYTADMVVNFGYILAFLFSLLYFIYVRAVLLKSKIDFMSLTYLVLLMSIPLNAIFYMSYGMLVFPLLFILILKIIFAILNNV